MCSSCRQHAQQLQERKNISLSLCLSLFLSLSLSLTLSLSLSPSPLSLSLSFSLSPFLPIPAISSMLSSQVICSFAHRAHLRNFEKLVVFADDGVLFQLRFGIL